MALLILPSLMNDCPEFWQNFAQDKLDWDDMRQALDLEYSAHCVDYYEDDLGRPGGLVIKFDQDELYTLFMLKWS